MDDFKNYKREFIQVSSDTVMLLHIFEKDTEHSIEDVSLAEDYDVYEEAMYNLRKEAAAQFIKQLEGNECIAFVKALKEECENYLEKNTQKQNQVTDLYEAIMEMYGNSSTE